MKKKTNHSMRRNNTNIILTTARRTAMGCLLLLALAGSALAQSSSNPKYVIKKGDHYLAHVKVGENWVLRDVEVFHPDSCLWASGPNIGYNYYFVDHEGKYRYLNAPLELNGTLGLSASHPGTQILGVPTSDYYFYDWDYGMARGEQVGLENCDELYHGLNETGTQCWKVVWVSYENGQWQMSSDFSYNPVSTYIVNPAPYRNVTITSHDGGITSESGGITDLVLDNIVLETVNQTASPDGRAEDYTYTITPEYTLYDFEAVNNTYFSISQESHYFFENEDHSVPPTSTTNQDIEPTGYEWNITGDGIAYLSLTNANTAQPTLTYASQNTSNSHVTATLTLTVTYDDGATQTRSATVTVMTQCQNPGQASAPVITYEGVTVSWLPTASSYTVSWEKKVGESWTFAGSESVENVTSYQITGLDSDTDYRYRVKADCFADDPDPIPFHTKPLPNALVYGAVFGGGRMADVTGKTEVVIINCERIEAVYGGNDIAGTVHGADGSTITLGVKNDDPYSNIDTTTSSIGVNIGSVYGGGNGYYAYLEHGTAFGAASYNTEYDILNGDSISVMTPMHTVGTSVWTNQTGATKHLVCPTIPKSNITVNTDYVKIDTLFGGAKNAILNDTENDVNITVNGGTIFALFGGNNFGGSLGYQSHENITVTNTKTQATVAAYNSNELGRDFGIGYLFGGGNKVQGQHVNITITGGQCDTVFAGGNAADVRSAELTVNCDLTSGTAPVFGKTYSAVISSYSEGTLTMDNMSDDYAWDGTGIYNVRTLFGGNNRANMSGLPILTLTSGSIGTVYGGGNAGDMLAKTEGGSITFDEGLELDNFSFDYSTKVVVNSDKMIIDNLYGGCQMSNVYYSTWVQLENGHVGTIYGGCNVSGDVGSTRHNLDATPFVEGNPNPEYQQVYGGTYVEVIDGAVYKDLFAGSNGLYHCNDGFRYIEGINYADPEERYVGMYIPTHNETYAVIRGGTIKGNVYAGANMAPVGFTIAYVNQFQSYSSLVGLASVRMLGGNVGGNVFGGGNMASINGSNEVRVSGGSIGGALYGGNDRTGQAGQISNRIMPESYDTASDDATVLTDVKTYVGVTGNPIINTVYGGGNGLYKYYSSFDEVPANPELPPVVSCNLNDLPIQSNIFVDIALEGGANSSGTAGHIDYVYGGGNGVNAEGFVKVFINVQEIADDDDDHIGTIFGGNNLGNLDIVPDIILVNGYVHDVYGGCNAGGMAACLDKTRTFTANGVTYDNVGSYVRLLASYDPDGEGSHEPVIPNVKISGNVYGGCRMNGVLGIDMTDPSNPVEYPTNTLILVEGGYHTANLFGGSDISGHISGTSQVVVTGGQVGNIYGGGNGNYDYTSTAFSGLDAPSCANTQIDMLGGTVGATGIGNEGHIFGGGYGQLTTVTGNVLINYGVDNNVASQYPLLVGDLYGGSALGSVNTDASNNTTINVYNGTITGPVTNLAPADNIYGNIFGGGLGQKDPDIAALVYGKVYVNIGKSADANFTDLQGQATLVNCNVYGCNNQNGSPQDDVFVNVYSTAHTTTPINNTVNGNAFAILQVFGGGNQAHYAPEDNDPESNKKAHVYIYGCDNTVQYVYGGGNAADAVGVVTLIGGGHYNEIYGGGNGAVVAANIGKGGIGLNVLAGRVTYLFEGNNKNGNVVPVEQGGIGIYTPDPEALVSNFVDCGELIVESYFFGDNEAEHWGDIVHTIECEEAEDYHYTYLYAGSRWAIVYGDIKLTVCGGVIERLFGGSKGYALYNLPAHVRRFPTFAEIAQDIEDHPNQADRKYSQALLNHMGYDPEDPTAFHAELSGRGGNIELIVMGGTIGEVIGGCDELGNVEGKITVIIDDAGNENCPLQIGDIYGASNMTYYKPWDDENNGVYYDPTGDHAEEAIQTPKVIFIKGTTGLEYDFDESETIDEDEKFDGNIFGGANQGNITSNPKVIVGDGTQGATATPISIGGSVFGGGNKGDVTGSPEVMIVPQTQTFTTTLVEPSGHENQNLISVTYPRGQAVPSGASVGEDIDLRIVAKPYPYGCKFKEWSIVSGNGTITNKNALNTLFSMGTEPTTLKAEFEVASTYALTITSPVATEGSVSVTDCQGNAVTIGSPVSISEGAVLDIVATPATGYKFAGWSIESGSGTIVNLNSATTTFTMGNSTTRTVLKASFVEEEPEP